MKSTMKSRNTPQQITSLSHPQVKQWLSLRQDAAERALKKRVLIQGKKIVEERAADAPLRKVIVTDGFFNSGSIDAEETWIVTEAIMKKITGAPTPEGIAAEVDLPEETSLLNYAWILALDGVTDPGNMGTLLRTAFALGWEGVFLLPGSCDPYNDKALRASMGAIFHLPRYSGSHEELMALQKKSLLPFYSADLIGTSIEEINPLKGQQTGAILVLGSESHGVSATMRLHSQPITIPMRSGIDSLNVGVAGGIMLYMLRKHISIKDLK